MPSRLLTQLDDRPVGGVCMGNVAIMRLDLTGGLAPGNKSFKLSAALQAARGKGIRRLVSFGGAWSNHLHALAALGYQQGFETVGLVRGEADPGMSAMLRDALAWGMQIKPVSRAEYRQRNDPAYLAEIRERYAPCWLIPEGGASSAGARASMAIAYMARKLAPATRRVVVPVGTGTTLAGLSAGLDSSYRVYGIAALKGASDLEQRTLQALEGCAATDIARWCILHHEHCGGFARVTDELREFVLEFEEVHAIPLEPLYTGKMLLAIQRHLRSGEWDADKPLLAIHTGGLQGRRGFPW